MMPYTLGTWAMSIALIGFLVVPRSSSAQPKGHWERTFVYSHSIPTCVVAIDSERAFVLIDTNARRPYVRFRTINGGTSWQQVQVDSTLIFPNADNILSLYDPFVVLPDGEVKVEDSRGFWTSKDEGFTWYRESIQPVQLDFTQFGLRFFSEEFGITTIQGFRGFSPGDSMSVYQLKDVGKDSGNEALERSSIFIGKQTFRGARFVDSLRGCAWLDTVNYHEFLWTTDGGVTWDQRTAIRDTHRYATFLTGPPDADKILYLVYGGPDSSTGTAFAVTTDAGFNWRNDSSIGGQRIFKMESPVPSMLWAFVGHSLPYDINLASPFRHGTYADSLFFSSDHGTTWYKDAKSFVGDTMVDMFWADSAHGYILSMRDRSTYISRWVPDNSSVAMNSKPAPESLKILDSPVGETLSIASTLEDIEELTIVDLLGRTLRSYRQHFGQRIDLDATTLPAGCYVLRAQSRRGSLAQVFIKQ
jgi:hypothetical protein